MRFKADIHPDLDQRPSLKILGEIIIELKTGRQKTQHAHQTMCYLMTQFGLGAVDHLGFVLYSDKGSLKSFLIRAVEPDLKYFLDMVLHRNSYMLNPRFFLEFRR